MKGVLYLLAYLLVSAIIINCAREGGVYNLLELIWMGGTFVYMYRERKSISGFFLKLPFPRIAIFVLASLPFMLVEENINCLPSGCELVPFTVPFLIIYLLIVRFFVLRFKIVSLFKILLIFCSIGVLWEMFLGAVSTEFLALPPLWIGLIATWTWLSYAYLTLIPVEILLSQKNLKARVRIQNN